MNEDEPGTQRETAARKDNIFDEGFLVGITGLGNFFNFVFHIYMSRNLGPNGYSALTSLLSLLFIVAIPVVTVQTTVTKFVAQFTAQGEDGKVRQLFIECLKRASIAAFALMTLIIFGAPLIGEFLKIQKHSPIILTGVLLFVTFIIPVFWAVLQGREQFGFLGVSYFIGFTAKCGLGILFVIIGWGVGGVLLGVVLSVLLAFAIGFWPIRDVFAPTLDDDQIDMRALYRFAGPVAVALFFLSFFCNLDIALVRHFYGDEGEGLRLAGYYATASIVGKSFLFLPLGIILALFPKVARKKATGENPLPILIRGLGLQLVLSAAGIVVCIVLARYVALFLGKTDAPELVALIKFFGIAITPVAATMILVNFNLANEHHRFIWVLVPVIVLTFAGVWLYHPTPLAVLLVLGIGGFALFFFLLAFTIRTLR